MVYIKGLKFRGFKSFRKAEATFPKGYVCLAGPNGSGKSNVTDGIRFALGEASLKALRAKRVSELINTSCKFAEVTLFIDGERQYELRRGINADGKTFYRINGKKSTRTLVMEELRQYGLEAGSHNIIAQGQVQKIVEMNAKERRQIIDSVSGVAEFDAKKGEALSELAQVDQKINDAKIVLAEREGMLTELEKEKDAALEYTSAQTGFRRAKASIATAEHNRLNKSFTDAVRKHSDLSAALEELSKQESALSARIAELSGQKQQVLDKLNSSGSREAAMKEIEGIKVSISSEEATLQAQKRDSDRLEGEEKAAKDQLSSLKKSQASLSGEIASLSSQLKPIAAQIASLEAKSGAKGGSEPEALQKKLDAASEKISSLRERKAALDASLSEMQKMLEMRKEEKARLSEAVGDEASEKLSGERSLLEKEVASRQLAIDRLFEQERELNRALPDMERRMLSLREKATVLRSSIAPSAMSFTLKAVDELCQGGMKGIFGPVSNLITCDPKHSQAVEAAAGQRLNYVVVDSMDTAIKVIEKLKAQKAGRCTFIPLDMPSQQQQQKEGKAQGCLGSLIEFVGFEPAYRKAMAYVFSDTLLFDSVQNAKKAGIGTARMVSLEGELIERSGIISGGSQRGSLLSQSSLSKIEADVEAAKKERDSVLSRLYEIREEMARARREKADCEVKLRGIEIEEKSAEERKAGTKKAREAISQISTEISALEKEIAAKKAESAKLASEAESALALQSSLKSELAALQEKAKRDEGESARALNALYAQKSALEAKLESAKAELSRQVLLQSEREEGAKGLAAAIKACRQEVDRLIASVTKSRKLQEEKEQKFTELSAASKKLFERMTGLESQISEVSAQLGKLKAESERKGRDLSSLEANRQVAEQRLADLKAQLEEYAGVPTIDATRAELEELAKSSELKMASLGSVNLRAPELYVEKKKDIDDIKSRVESLANEKAAVMRMMDEIDVKKREIFLTTFTAVNDNFRKLFGYAFKGEGAMVLEQPSSPFEGGLLVRVREGSHDKYLESMSGGEKSLLALIFIFAIQMYKAAPFYILDEADAALDKENSRKLAELVKQLASKTQFLVVTHNDTMLTNAEVALGVTRTDDGSKIVGVHLTSVASVAKKTE
jgi:chromosome segregation protein